MMNSVRGRPKRSLLEKMTGRYIFYIFFVLLAICIYAGIMYASWEEGHDRIVRRTYDHEPNNWVYNFFVRAGNWLLILGNFVPISLLLTLEVTKLFQAYLISIDQGLVSSNGIECKVNTSALNEELGQIDYIFSDKTGTLTKNEMRFKYLIVGDKVYGEGSGYKGTMPEVKNVDFSDPAAWEAVKANGSTPESKKFMETVRMLALCHTIVVDKDGNFSASSPDELAFVGFAKLVGCEFKGSDEDNNFTVDEFGTLRTYQLLDTFEFTSDRKRMSTIIKDEQGQITMYTKGADSIMIPRLSKEGSQEADQVMKLLDKQAETGLRTLVLAYKNMDQSQYQQFKSEYEVGFVLS